LVAALEARFADTLTGREISSQPQCWRQAAELWPEVAWSLPPAAVRTAVIGCGTSFYMAQALAAVRELAGGGETDAFAASEWPSQRRYEWVVALSRSGTTTEVLRALDLLAPDTQSVAICGSAGQLVSEKTQLAIPIAFADEQSVVQTRFATTALALWRVHHGADIESLAGQADAALQQPLPPLDGFDRFVFLGTGFAVGLANEAALKLREAAGANSESYPAMEFRHGPISAVDRRSLVWILGPVPANLVAETEATGATVYSAGLDPMVELVLAQRAAVDLALARGRNPDRPPHLNRSVILAESGHG
jgi:fructoselysine-6-P-deglycase FrlB-like protein